MSPSFGGERTSPAVSELRTKLPSDLHTCPLFAPPPVHESSSGWPPADLQGPMSHPDVERLLGRLPEAERAQATAKLAHMSQALEHATKRLTAELETAEEVTFTPATICTRHMHKSTPCTPSALL